MLSCIPFKFIFSMLNLLIQMFCLSLKLTHISSCYWSVFLDSCYLHWVAQDLKQAYWMKKVIYASQSFLPEKMTMTQDFGSTFLTC